MAEQKRIRSALRIPAKSWNAFVEAANAEARRRHNQTAENKPSVYRVTFEGLARNPGAVAFDWWGAVELTDPIIGPDDRLAEWQRVLNFDARVATQQTNRLGIMLEPVRAGAIGRVALDGIVPCLVDVTDAGHEFATLTVGQQYLTSAESGPAQIFWAEGGTGLQWCYVRIPASGGGDSSGDTTIAGDITVGGDTHLHNLYLLQVNQLLTPPAGRALFQFFNGSIYASLPNGNRCIVCGKEECCCAKECTPPPGKDTWTWVNQGNADLLENDGGTLTLYDPSGSVSPDLHLIVQGLPDPPYIVTAKVIATLPVDAGKPTFGVAWRESSSGKIHAMRLTLNASGIIALGVDPSPDSLWLSSDKWSAPDTADGEYKATGSGMAQAVPVFLRLEDDGTNRVLSYSGDGIHFTEYDSQLRGDYFDDEANQAGLLIDASEGTGGAYLTICCWDLTLTEAEQGIEVWGTAEVYEGDYEGAEQSIEVWGTAQVHPGDWAATATDAGIEIWGEADVYAGDYVETEQGFETWGTADVYPGEAPPTELCVTAESPYTHLTKTLTQDGNLFQWESDEFTHDEETVRWYLAYTSHPSPTWTLELIGASVVASYTASGTLSDPTTFAKSTGTGVPDDVSLSLDVCPFPTTDECTECPEAPVTWETDSPEMGEGEGAEAANATLTHAIDCAWTSGEGWTLLYIAESDLWRLDWNSIEAWTLAGSEWDCMGENVMTHAELDPITLTPGGAP